jgi:hypothetical protein
VVCISFFFKHVSLQTTFKNSGVGLGLWLGLKLGLKLVNVSVRGLSLLCKFQSKSGLEYKEKAYGHIRTGNTGLPSCGFLSKIGYFGNDGGIIDRYQEL